MRVEFFIDLKEGCGYRKPCEIHETTEINVSFDVKSLACAQRQLKALVKDDIIDGYSVNCDDKEYYELWDENKKLTAENKDLKERNKELGNRVNNTVVKLCDAYSDVLSRLENARLTNEELRTKNEELETELQQCKVLLSDLEEHMERYNELLSGINN